jgi:hypothetical protein
MASCAPKVSQSWVVQIEETAGAHAEAIRTFIAQRAYRLYEQRDSGDASDVEDWLRAEKQLLYDDFNASTSGFELHIQYPENRQVILSFTRRSLVVLHSCTNPNSSSESPATVMEAHIFTEEIDPAAVIVHVRETALRVRVSKKNSVAGGL